jgi:hypothetical protein
MKKVSSISLMIMGTGLLPVALLMDNIILKSILLIGSIVLNIAAVVKNFREKKEKNL